MYCPLPSPPMPPDFIYARLSHRKNKAQKLSAPAQSGAQARVFANVPNRSGLCCERRSNMGVKEGREGEMCVRIIRLTKARRHWKGRGNSVRSRQTIRMRGGGQERPFRSSFACANKQRPWGISAGPSDPRRRLSLPLISPFLPRRHLRPSPPFSYFSSAVCVFAARFCRRRLLLFPVKTGGEGKLFLLLVFFGRLPKFSRGGGGGGSHDGKKKGVEIGQTNVPLIFHCFDVISLSSIRNFRNVKGISQQLIWPSPYLLVNPASGILLKHIISLVIFLSLRRFRPFPSPVSSFAAYRDWGQSLIALNLQNFHRKRNNTV